MNLQKCSRDPKTSARALILYLLIYYIFIKEVGIKENIIRFCCEELADEVITERKIYTK